MSWFKKMWSGGGGGGGGAEPDSSANPDHSPVADRSADEPISEAEADEVLPEENRSLISQLIRQHGVTMNMDLSRITFPTFILEPRAMLEKLGDVAVHPAVFADIARGANAEERAARVVRWYMSAFHRRPRGVKKPLNSVLGEVFECTYTAPALPAGDAVQWTAEQVSHHPPVSAFHARTASGAVVMQGTYAPKSRFLGNSVASIGEGTFAIFLPQHDEVYLCTWPTLYARGIVFGRLLMEIGGPVMIRCPSTNVHADVEFVVKGYFTGTHHAVRGVIYAGNPKKKEEQMPLRVVEGNWTERMNIRDAKQGSVKSGGGGEKAQEEGAAADEGRNVLFDYKSEVMGECVVDEGAPLSSDEYNSRVHWRATLEALRRNDNDEATKQKTAVEEHQRKLRAERTAPHVPRLFEVIKECEEYVYVGPGRIETFPRLSSLERRQ